MMRSLSARVGRRLSATLATNAGLWSVSPSLWFDWSARMGAAAALRPVFDALIAHKPVRHFGDIAFPFDLQYSVPLSRIHALRAFYTGAYEPLTQRILARYLKPGSCFIDVGAHIGYFSALALSLGATVHAFDPLPYNVGRLKRMQAMNPGAPLTVHDLAVSDSEGVLTLHVTKPPQIAGHSLVAGVIADGELANTVEVRVRRLADVLSEHGVRKIAMLKMDIEGHEFTALRGLAPYFQIDRPPIWCEVMPGLYPLEELDAFLKLHGYRAESVSGHGVDLPALRSRTDVLLCAIEA